MTLTPWQKLCMSPYMKNKLVRISEAAAMVGVSVDTLRNWDASGEFKPTFKTKGGLRYYATDHLGRLLAGEVSGDCGGEKVDG